MFTSLLLLSRNLDLDLLSSYVMHLLWSSTVTPVRMSKRAAHFWFSTVQPLYFMNMLHQARYFHTCSARFRHFMSVALSCYRQLLLPFDTSDQIASCSLETLAFVRNCLFLGDSTCARVPSGVHSDTLVSSHCPVPGGKQLLTFLLAAISGHITSMLVLHTVNSSPPSTFDIL